jgi:hypothetical protein
MTEVTLLEFRGTLAECELIAGWRNDNAAAFPKQDKWTGVSQFAWYNEVYSRDPSLNLYWVCVDYTKIGTVGMRIKGGVGEMMWMILGNKNLKRGGYMRQGMRKLMEAYGLGYYFGLVMPDNKAGLQFQIDNGFSVVGERDGMLYIERYFDGTWPERSRDK